MNLFTNQVYQETWRMLAQLEYRGLADNFKVLCQEQAQGLNQKSCQWSQLLNEMSKGAEGV